MPDVDITIGGDDSDLQAKLNALPAAVQASANKLADAYKPLASAFNPAISAARQYEAQQKAAADAARKAARDAADAYRKASADEKDAARETMRAKMDAAKQASDAARRASQMVTAATRQAANDQKQAARDTANAQKQAAQDAANAQKQAARDAATATRQAANDQRQAARDTANVQKQAARDAADAQKQAARDASQAAKEQADYQANLRKRVGLALYTGGGVMIGKGIKSAMTMETNLETISAFTGSDAKAKAIYNEIDKMALKSVDNLSGLVTAGKTLAGGQIYNLRNLKAADDLAATGRERGIKANDVATAFVRLQNGDFGEGFQRVRELGINRKELEAQGLKFNSSNEYQGKPQQAVEGVVRAIEKKFGGLSERLSTKTAEGALSNLADAADRSQRAILGELLPSINWGARALSGAAGIFAELPEPARKFIAYLGVAGYGAYGVSKLLAEMGGDLGTTIVAIKALRGTLGVGSLAAGGAAAATPAVAGAATTGTSIGLGAALGVGVVGTAGGLLAGYGLYKAGQAVGVFDREQGFLDRLETGAGRLGSFLTSGSTEGYDKYWQGKWANDRIWQINQQRAKAKEKAESDKLLQNLNPASTLAAPSAGGYSVTSGDGGSQAEIESLEDQLRRDDLEKEDKAKLQDRLFYARRAAKHNRQNESARRKAERETEKARKAQARDAGYLADATGDEAAADIDERIGTARSDNEIQSLHAKRQLQAEIRAIKSASKRSGNSEGVDERLSALRDLYAARERARDADLEMQIASLAAQKVLAEAGAKASTQEGARRESTLRSAQAKAARIRDVGRLKSEAEREEARDVMAEAQERLNALGNPTSGRSNAELQAALAAGRLTGSYNGVRAIGGRMFGMNSSTAPYAPNGAGSFVGSDSGLMASGIARAKAAFAANGMSTEAGVRTDIAGGGRRDLNFNSRVENIVYDALARIQIHFGPATLDNSGSTASAARSLRPGG